MNYYLSNPKETYDLLGIIRKIRTNSLKKNELIAPSPKEAPKEAYQYPELYEIFIEQDRILQEEIDAPQEPKQGIMKLLKNSVLTLKDDMTSAAITGVLIIAIMTIVAGSALKLPAIIAGLFVPIICCFIFNLCLIAHLRLSRVQLVSMGLIGKTCKQYWKDLLIAAVIPASIAISAPWVLSSFIGWKTWIFASSISVPIIAYFIYLPIIIFDKEVGVRQALGVNKQVISDHAMELMLPIIGLLTINIIAGPFILLTLPITLLAMAHLYDDYFTEY